MAEPGPRRHVEDEIRIGWRMGGIGMEVAAQVAAGALLGWAFDAWRGTSPKGILVGSILGIVVAMWTLIRGTLRLNRLLETRHPTRGRGTPPADRAGDTGAPGREDDDDDADDARWR